MGLSDEHESDGLPVALVRFLEPVELDFDGRDPLRCVYARVDGRQLGISEFLDDLHRCDDLTRWSWSARRRDRSAQVNIDLLHACGGGSGLRLSVGRSGFAGLAALAQRQVLVVADGPWLPSASGRRTRMVAYGVEGPMVERALAEVARGLRRLASVN